MTSEQESTVRRLIGEIRDPEIGRALSELDAVRDVRIDGKQVQVEIDLPTPAYPNREAITRLVEQAVIAAGAGRAEDVNVLYSATVRGKNTGGALGLKVANIIAVGSGKGGVGKSTIAAGLAYGLHHFGARTGLMDADVYGPSIPHLLGVDRMRPVAGEQEAPDGTKFTRIEPIDARGVKTISMGFFIDPNQAVVWRGPLLHRAITQFLKDTNWGELDYLIIDLPPGTGDVALTLSQLVGLAGAVVVCTPQQVALLDAVKAVNMYQQVKIPLLGIVENMSGDIFGRGGAEAKARELGIPFLGQVPIEASIRVKGDEGKIADLVEEGSPAREPLLHVCQQTAIQIARQILETPTMPTLEIL